MREGARESGCSVHAYVLMTNHVHLLLTPDHASSSSDLMKFVGERYVRRFNQRCNRSGTLWEGRFRSNVVDTEGYFLTCQRYIELNPVRAGMVAHPRGHPWSSYRANAEGEPSLVVATHPVFEALGATTSERRRRYRELFAVPIADAMIRRIRRCVNGGYALGSAGFVKRLEQDARKRAHEGLPGRPLGRREQRFGHAF